MLAHFAERSSEKELNLPLLNSSADTDSSSYVSSRYNYKRKIATVLHRPLVCINNVLDARLRNDILNL